MRPIPVEPPAFFHRGPSPLARLAFFGVLSLALLFADTRYRYLENIRQFAGTVLYPVQRAVEMPIEAVAWVGRYFADKARLAEENEDLRERLIAQAPVVGAYSELRDENARLKTLLDLQARYGGAATAAEVLYTGRDPFTQKLFVDKGTHAGLASGEAVIDDRGVVGQVTRVFPYMAEVTLVTDKDQAVPVKVERSGVRSVLYGNGTGRAPELRFTAPSADVRVGDRLVTSGIDGTYPPNLPVAEVMDIERDTGQMFARIAVKPLAGVDRSMQVLVLAQAAASPARPEEPAESDGVKRGRGKGRRG
ncbi:MAG TPA: rod shape-determining protein MreC [Casimicrobiaceae bacterium]|jgi:rod shape-determining protein MreC|nr:rod shape-determining protein MreC [Casimicrobiaceae bacterium]